MIDSLWVKMSNDPLSEGYAMKHTSPPAPDRNSLADCRKLCEDNLCGCYDTNWSCPPGAGTECECLEKIGKYSECVVIFKKFENIDLNDKEKVDEIAVYHQDLCRRFGNLLRSNGYSVLALADGKCRFCGICSYPEPCIFPDQMVPSVSSFGIDMESYMKSQNIDFCFEKDALTLYGLILYNRP